MLSAPIPRWAPLPRTGAPESAKSAALDAATLALLDASAKAQHFRCSHF